jgi:DNA repair protein RadC
MPITDWALSERPREKLLEKGARTLTDAELVAVLLRTGLPGKTAVDLGREILGDKGLSALLDSKPNIKGVGPAKRAQFEAAIEIARRALEERMKSGSALTSPGAVRDYLRLRLGGLQHEVFVCIFLDAQHRAIKADELFRGTLTQTSVYPREVVKAALAANAAAVIFAHNHPSGAAQPSQADELLTRNLKEALALVDVKVLDHFVVGGDSAMSFAERGLL